MRTKNFRAWIGVALVSLSTTQMQGALVAGWDFSTGSLPSIAASSKDTTYNSVSGTPTLGVSGGAASSSVINTAPGVFRITFAGNHASDLNGTVLAFNILTTGAASISTLSVDYNISTFSAISTLVGTWSYQLNNTGGFTTAATRNLQNTGVGSATDSLGFNLNAGDTLALRFTFSGATGGNNGNISFNDFTISGGAITPVPEPMHYALLGFFFLFAVAHLGRAYVLRLAA